MCHFLSHQVESVRSGGASRFNTPASSPSSKRGRYLCLTLLVVWVAFLSSAFAQQTCPPNCAIPTSHVDNTRSNANSNETLLAPSNVNQYGFGHLFSFPVDYEVMAQPLYMPNVNIGGVSHNVIYVATQADSVYAIDADTGTELWYASMLDGGTTASGKNLPCGTGGGFYQEGIIGTPVIDPNTTPNPTIYLVAKTVVNGVVVHNLHALDITTGLDLPNSPVLIQASSVSNSDAANNYKPHVANFDSLHEKNRPGLLLLNGTLYLGFGSNYCNDDDTGWVLSYDEASLTQVAVYNTSPDWGLTSIWQAGSGLAADQEGNIYFETAEAGSHGYDVPNGGQTYCNSVVELNPSQIDVIDYEGKQYSQYPVSDYFTPSYVAFLNPNDLDLSSTGAIVIPDADAPVPELVAGGKEGVVYVLNRDSLGMFQPGDRGVIQELGIDSKVVPGVSDLDVQFGAPAYWNSTVYFAPDAAPLTAYPLLPSGLLGTPLTTGTYVGSHSPSISANGNNAQTGVLWVISGPVMLAFNATTMQLLYSTNQAPNGRDKLPTVPHFVTQTVANGRVYVGTNGSLEAYGLYSLLTMTGGSNQTATVATELPLPLQYQVTNPYTGQPDVGATMTFSDGCTKAGASTCGSFNPSSATTDSNGNVSTTYTVPQKAGTYTLTANLTIGTSASGSLSTTATATPATGAKIAVYGGSKQSGAVGFNLANPLVAQVTDAYKNGVPGVTVTFTSNKGGVFNPSSAVTGANGTASTTLQLPSTPGTITVTAAFTTQSGSTLKVSFTEYAVAQVPTTISISSGNDQTAPNGTQLPAPLVVLVTDQFGNPFAGDNVNYSDNGAGGTFSSPNPVVTGTNGTASQYYTLPSVPNETITINATAAGISNPAVFTEYGQ